MKPTIGDIDSDDEDPTPPPWIMQKKAPVKIEEKKIEKPKVEPKVVAPKVVKEEIKTVKK